MQESKKEDEGPDDDLKGKNNGQYPASTKVGLGAGAGAGVLLTCVLICPCLYRKKRATDHPVLSKDSNLSESLLTLQFINNIAVF